MSPSGPLRRGRGRALTAAMMAASLLVAGCGGDDEGEAGGQTTTSAPPPTRTVTVPARTTPEREGTETVSPEEDAAKGPASPEDQPGGAGDEEAARSEVVLTGRGGRIGPLVVKVPPFIAIRVVLRSGDGKPYVLRIGGRLIRAGLKGAAASATFDGLRPGRRLVGSAVSGKVVIEASAEPGP